MASKRSLTIVISPEARDDLLGIWGDNIEKYGYDHAETYEGFLNAGINALADTFDQGKAPDGYPELRYLTLKRSRKGEGHNVIYQIDAAGETVNVLRIYHTRMDMQGRLEEEFH